jgi:hypothetical protein
MRTPPPELSTEVHRVPVQQSIDRAAIPGPEHSAMFEQGAGTARFGREAHHLAGGRCALFVRRQEFRIFGNRFKMTFTEGELEKSMARAGLLSPIAIASLSSLFASGGASGFPNGGKWVGEEDERDGSNGVSHSEWRAKRRTGDWGKSFLPRGHRTSTTVG